VILTGDMNSPGMLRDLRRLAPDYIVWGGGGILKPETIETAPCGVLNAHPALLPWVRGCGVVGHSVELGIPIGVTLHYIDKGIDTGSIIERRLLKITDKDTSLAALEAATDELSAEMMADAVQAIKEHGRAPTAVAQDLRRPLFRWPDEDSRKTQEACITAGRAVELFRSWSSLCRDANRLVLPAGFIDGEVPALKLNKSRSLVEK
jgi:methionyl-tRNA formyltransferase